MTLNEKQKFIAEIVALLQAKLEVDTASETAKQDNTSAQPVEMLTIKECTKEVKGLSEHTVRQLVAQGKIPFIVLDRASAEKYLSAKRYCLRI